MASRQCPSAYLASAANLAAQKASWVGGQNAAEQASIASAGAANAAYAAAANAASLDDPAGSNSAAQRVNAAGVTYAGSTSTAFKAFNEQIATHLKEYVDTVDGAGKTYGEAKAGADRDLKIATANANYSKATNDNFDYAAAMATANSQHAGIMGPASDDLETAKKNAAEKRAKDDAQSQKDVDDAVAAAEKIYADAVASARADESEDLAEAAETRDSALASLDASLATTAASTWAAQLADPNNATSDPWFDLAEDLASARSTRSTASATAAANQASAHALALEALEVDLSTASQNYGGATSAARQTYSDGRGAASVAFTNQTGQGGAQASGELAFADETGGNPGNDPGIIPLQPPPGGWPERQPPQQPKNVRYLPIPPAEDIQRKFVMYFPAKAKYDYPIWFMEILVHSYERQVEDAAYEYQNRDPIEKAFDIIEQEVMPIAASIVLGPVVVAQGAVLDAQTVAEH